MTSSESPLFRDHGDTHAISIGSTVAKLRSLETRYVSNLILEKTPLRATFQYVINAIETSGELI